MNEWMNEWMNKNEIESFSFSLIGFQKLRDETEPLVKSMDLNMYYFP